MPIKRVEITKPGGGKRLFGIPTVMDLFLQQAFLQMITSLFDPHFSKNGYGFTSVGQKSTRCGQEAHPFIQKEYRWVVNMEAQPLLVHPAGRPGQGTNKRGHRFVRYADDWHYLRHDKKRRRTGDGIGHPVCGGAVKVEGESGKELGRQAVEYRSLLGFSFTSNCQATIWQASMNQH